MSHPPKTRSSSPDSGTTSLIFGERPSVRLPRRIVPIWVNEPIGCDKPLRIAKMPAIVVVLTAPRPTSRTPSLPCAGAIFTGVGTGGNYISHQSSVTSHQSNGQSHQSNGHSRQSNGYSLSRTLQASASGSQSRPELLVPLSKRRRL